jgi:hypothetical protein
LWGTRDKKCDIGGMKMKEVYVVYERSGTVGQYSRLVCVFNTQDEADKFCKSSNTPSHVGYTNAYLEAIPTKMFYESVDALRAANKNEIRI